MVLNSRVSPIVVKVALECISADLIDVVPIVDNFEKNKTNGTRN